MPSWADRQYMAPCALPLLRRISTSISWKTSVQKVWSTSDDVNHGKSRLKNNFKWNVWGERRKKVVFFSLKVPLRVRHKWMWAQNELITASPSPRVLGRHKVEGKGSRWAESLVSFSTPLLTPEPPNRQWTYDGLNRREEEEQKGETCCAVTEG